jgi:metal-responsive CopG/Arc/MetJ family transcriptional regulator
MRLCFFILTVINSQRDCADTRSDHLLLVIVELNRLMIQRKCFELVVVEEIDSLFIQFQSETFQE